MWANLRISPGRSAYIPFDLRQCRISRRKLCSDCETLEASIALSISIPNKEVPVMARKYGVDRDVYLDRALAKPRYNTEQLEDTTMSNGADSI